MLTYLKKLFFILFIIPSFCHAQSLESNAYNDFTGKIGQESNIFMSLYLKSDGSITGHYFFIKNEKEIIVKGSVSAGSILLREFYHKGNVTALFRGTLTLDGGVHGIKTQISSGKKVKFSLELSSIIDAPWGHRYQLIGAKEDTVIESFARKIKYAIESSNYKWISNHISYPISVYTNGTKKTINDAKLFLKYSATIFTKKFKNKMAHVRTKDLFTNWRGAMLGNGDIWISYVSKNIHGPFYLKIIEFNFF